MSLHYAKAYVGWYATAEDYDGPPALVGWGLTLAEAAADWHEQDEAAA